MNILSLLLGHFNNTQPFYLYRIENSSILLFKLTDVCSFFNLPSPTELLHHSEQHQLLYRDKHQDIYITTNLLAPLAIKHNKFLLAELCKLKPTDYAAKLADSILFNLPHLECTKGKKDKSQYKLTNIELIESSLSATSGEYTVKSEPISPPPIVATPSKQQSDLMAIDSILTQGGTSAGAGSQSSNHQQTRRLSRTYEDQPNKKQKKNNDSPVVNILPKPIHTVSSQQQPPAQTLLAKRLANSNKKNLTIYAPSYGEQFTSTGIRSAPLNSNFLRQQQQVPSKATAQPHPLSQTTLRSPATASTTTTEFAIPPIVPSQQQPPHTAHPSSMHFAPHSPQYPSSAYGHSFPVTSGRVVVDSLPTTAAGAPLPPPKTPTHSALQRQQFMQPFEHLFDTIETTRTLKSTLDDQIRRSSTLMQTLQASSTTIEGLVRNQIKEAQKEILNRMEDSLENLLKRITVLERRLAVNGNSSSDRMEVVEEEESEAEAEAEAEAIEAETEAETVETQVQQSRQQRNGHSHRDLLVSPPTIVKSQNDIGPNEYHVMLDTLRERLDRLERQLES